MRNYTRLVPKCLYGQVLYGLGLLVVIAFPGVSSYAPPKQNPHQKEPPPLPSTPELNYLNFALVHNQKTHCIPIHTSHN